ncbi:MAG: TolC family protein [Bacteroidia bacterium]|nr:TolC family protein [Bacteroidia bacterium]MDW8347745.1 TolC family protein [Bacteroidia bacterium]
MYSILHADSLSKKTLSFEDFYGIIKEHHPLVRQLRIGIELAKAEKARANAAFIPKFGLQTDEKFLNQPYYSLLNANLKVPTWYGIDLKLQYEQNLGKYVNPENITPKEGLFIAGIGVPLMEGLIQNENRIRALQAKIGVLNAENELVLILNQIMMEASTAYWEWTYHYFNLKLSQKLYQRAIDRHKGICTMYFKGDRPASDTLESFTFIQDRQIMLLEAERKFTESQWLLNTFFWFNNQPMPISELLTPSTLQTVVARNINLDTVFTQHPFIRYYDYKIQQLNLDLKLKRNKILPEVRIDYNLLSKGFSNTWSSNNYKWRVTVAFPLWVQKELADVRITRYKLQQTQLSRDFKRIELNNKLQNYKTQLELLQAQNENLDRAVENFKILLKQEEIKFQMGESSIFLIIARENKLFEIEQKQIKIQTEYYKYENLFKALQMQF